MPNGTKKDPFTWGHYYDRYSGRRLIEGQSEVKKHVPNVSCYMDTEPNNPALIALVELKARERSVYAVINGRMFGPFGEVFDQHGPEVSGDKRLLLARRHNGRQRGIGE